MPAWLEPDPGDRRRPKASSSFDNDDAAARARLINVKVPRDPVRDDNIPVTTP